MTKQFKKHKYSFFDETSAKLGVAPSALAEACGYQDNVWHKWKIAGKMPHVAMLACECLLRRQRLNTNTTAREIFVLLVPNDKTAALIAFCQALGVEQAARVTLAG